MDSIGTTHNASIMLDTIFVFIMRNHTHAARKNDTNCAPFNYFHSFVYISA